MPTLTSPAPRARIVAAFAAIYLVWGSTYLAMRYAVESLPPFLMGGTRFVSAGSVLYLWHRARGAPRPAAAQWAWGALVGVLLLAVGNGGVAWAETRVASGAAALIVATLALWVVVLDWLRPGGRRPSALVLSGIVVGLAGVAVLVGPRGFGTGHIDVGGALALLLASFSWAAGSLLARSPEMPKPLLMGAAVQMLCGGTTLLFAGLLTGEASALHPSAVGARALLALGYLIVFGSLVAYTAYIWLVRHVAAAHVATYAYVNPIVAVLLGWAIAGEPLDARVLAASALIVGAVALVTLGQARAARSSTDLTDLTTFSPRSSSRRRPGSTSRVDE